MFEAGIIEPSNLEVFPDQTKGYFKGSRCTQVCLLMDFDSKSRSSCRRIEQGSARQALDGRLPDGTGW